uniref:PIP49_C domain-containing protein n=1 Tax=Steinernema glaseri TaxID=37863 RepID=A0A1I7YJU1_9BILA
MHAISGASTSTSLAYPYRSAGAPSKYGSRRPNAAEDLRQLVNHENSDSDSDSDTDIISLCCGSGGCCGCAADDGVEKSSSNGTASGFSPKVLFCSKPGRLVILIMTVLLGYLLYSALIVSSASSSGARNGAEKPKFNHSRATEVLGRLCGQYTEGEVAGSFCESLCVTKNYTIKDFYEGNKVVLTLKEKDKTFILKSSKAYLEDYDEVDPRVEEDHFTDKIVEIVNEQLMLGFPVSYKNHVLQLLWPIDKANSSVGRRQVRPPMTQAERRSLWALMQQEEYMNFRILPLSRVVPKIQGTCGHFYQPEYLVPFHMKGYYVNLKAKILVHLMGTLKLFYEFLNEPLQWCDVKFDNMGLSSEYPKRFVIMDSDMLYTESKLNQLLTSRRCSTDDDCQFFDCHAQCNTTKGFCSGRTNDNIDVFCSKLVTQLFGTFWTKSNRYLAACHDESHNSTQRLADLRLVWSWNLSDV